MGIVRCPDCGGTGVVPVKFIPGVDRDYCGSCGGAGEWESDPRDDELAAARKVVEAARNAVEKGVHAERCIVNGCINTPECPATVLKQALAAYDEATKGTREG